MCAVFLLYAQPMKNKLLSQTTYGFTYLSIHQSINFHLSEFGLQGQPLEQKGVPDLPLRSHLF